MTLLSCLLVSLALGGDFYVEGPALGERAGATEMARIASVQGHRARVVRRYRHGAGWEYVMLIEGFDDAAPAAEVARDLTAMTGRAIAVFEIDGGVARPVVDARERPVDGPDSTSEPSDDDAADLIRRAVRAHGGAEGGVAAVTASPAVLFRYRRTLTDGLEAVHVWARRGDAIRVSIDVVSGAGTSSVITCVPGAAWLEVDGIQREVDAARAASMCERLSPQTVLGLGLTLGRDLEERPELQELRKAPCNSDEGACRHALVFDGDRLTPPLRLELDEQWLLGRVTVGDGELTWFDDWRELDAGLTLPFAIVRRHRGVAIDSVKVQELDLNPTLPEDWFLPALPAAGQIGASGP